MTNPSSAPLKSSNELADERTKLALMRTVVALDRTLMAWVRTATSLISFGFTIYKFFQNLPAEQRVHRTLEPRGVALVMIGLGVAALAVATIDYRTHLAMLHRDYAQYGPFHRSLAAAVAATIAGLGILGFVFVFLRQ